jgi:nucleotide-binding universal stress UspA family protein
MQRIFVATDGSPGANRAVDAAARLAKVAGCKLAILTVGNNVSGAELIRLASTGGDLSKTLESAANRILSQARKRALAAGAPTVELQTAWGDPAQAIIDTVKRKKADILVVGRRGRSRLEGLLLGSVSQKLASLAPCTVMVVP